MPTSSRREKKEHRHYDGRDCRRVLIYEKERSARHNRFFTLCGIKFKDIRSEDLTDFLKDDLRASDYIFTVPSASESSQLSGKIGLLLPETDMSGGEVVRNRMFQLCRARNLQVQIGLAIYPDDATALGDIVHKAFQGGLVQTGQE